MFHPLYTSKHLFIQRVRMMTISQITHRIIFLFFAIVFLFASLEVTFHHHDNGVQHHDCSLCIAVNLFSSGDVEIHNSFVFYPTTTNLCQSEESFHQALSKFSVCSDRAPPVSISA
jgi:hypothetical protein